MVLPDFTTPRGAEEYPEFIPVSMAERAIVRHPPVFLFDEPRSNLDAKLRVQIRVERNRLHTTAGDDRDLRHARPGLGHDARDRVVVMKDGWIQQVGEPLELYSHPANRFVAGFIGSPTMNFVEVTIGETNGALGAESPGFRVAVSPAQTRRTSEPSGKAGPNVMVARVEPTLRMKVHDPVRLALNPERLHFFDTKTQLSI